MIKSKFQEALDPFWGCSVSTFEWDMKEHQASFHLDYLDNGVRKTDTIIFKDVNSLCYLERPSSNGHFHWNLIEITEIFHNYTCPDKIKALIHSKGSNFGELADTIIESYNFLINIWDSRLLINAQRLEINGINVAQ